MRIQLAGAVRWASVFYQMFSMSSAEAGEWVNREPSIRIGMEFRPGAENRFGVEVGGSLRYALVDQCSGWPVPETDCYQGALWPTAGPTALVSWRGGSRLTGFVGAVSGIGTAEVHSSGFFPLWALDARVGLGGDVEDGFGVGLGIEVARALGASVVVDSGPDFTAYRRYGFTPAALRVGALTQWGPKSGFVSSRANLALELSPVGGDEY